MCVSQEERKDSIYLVASITYRAVAYVTAWLTKVCRHRAGIGPFDDGLEGVIGVMPMFHADKARRAKVIVLTDSTGKEIFLGKCCLRA